MLKNKKGFMLVEVIIASTVIITTMVYLFTSFNSLFVKYESRINYHDIDAMYATKEMTDYLFENDLNKFINTNLYTNESIYLIQFGNCKLTEQSSFCNTIKNLYNVETMIFTSYDAENLKNLKGTGKNQITINVDVVKNETMKDYIDYVIGYYNITDSNITEDKNQYDYVLLTEIKDGENYYYASLPIR